MPKSAVFACSCASFLLGVFLASCFAIPDCWVFAGMAVFVLIIYCGLMQKDKLIFLPAIFLFFAGLGILRLNATFVNNEYENFFNQNITFEGVIAEDPDIRQDRQLLTFQPVGQKQKVLMTTMKSVDYAYGDRVAVSGKLQEAKNFEDFDYQKYLERYNIYAVMKYPKILVLKSNQGSMLKQRLLQVKAALSKELAGKIAEPHSALALGVLIGAKRSIPPEIADNFRATGLSHIVAVSGFNISILVVFLGWLAYLFGRRASFHITLLVIAGFAIIAGMTSSVIRAALMGGMLLWAFSIGRMYYAGNAILFSAALMVLINPRILAWDVGFQLSFLATLGIVYGMPVLEDWFSFLPKALGLKSVLLASCSAIAATLPLSLLQFGQFPSYALLANILVLPLVPPLMFFGFFALLPFLGPGFALVAELISAYIFSVTGFFAAMPFSVLQIGLSATWVFALYICLGLVVFRHNKKTGAKFMNRLGIDNS